MKKLLLILLLAPLFLACSDDDERRYNWEFPRVIIEGDCPNNGGPEVAYDKTEKEAKEIADSMNKGYLEGYESGYYECLYEVTYRKTER